ncbi:protein ENHANCED DISEASE RESISTANCE 4 isoform X2 [Cinnamomum micranthum f. kanehirae]|uniref:Protein ENHANCED DISEASE RESISTANCE 4 isoform X2 n=1 Tax=Cinnamomum micranthum f. kanehirae TaxID=337451 RepID=A0A443NP06_9MAGN|nr:protein ENHANCED DISEASE RESISTANCE 4 isoform X2 [Cinnamomum micranthum f. kanehirae]
MEEGGKVRVVRCPKCHKLLPELPDIPVYRCGGCDTTLQAKNQQSARADTSSEKSDEEKVRFCDNSDSISGKRRDVLNELSETERKSDGVEVRRKEGVLPERKENSSSSLSSRGENRDILNDCSGSRGFEEPEPSRYDQGRYRRPSKTPVENWVASNNFNSHSDELIKANVKENGEASGVQRAAKRDGSLAFLRECRAAVEGSWYGSYPDEGPSNHHLRSAYENREKNKNQNLNQSDRVLTLEKDRAELLRKVDELRNQLSRSRDVSDNAREKVPAIRRMVPPNSHNVHEVWPTECAPVANGSLYPDNPIRRPLYLNNDQPVPLMGRHDMDVQDCYPPMHTPNDITGYRESFGPQVPRREPIVLHPPYGFYEQQRPCSGLHCYTKHCQMPQQISPTVFCNQQLPSSTTNHMFYHLDNSNTYGPGVYNHANTQLYSFEPQPHMRKPSDLEYDMGAFRRLQPQQRSVLAKGNRRSCRPIADGAPFITCCNCLKLLQLPQNFSLRERNQCKLRCGACSNQISFTLDGKRFVFAFASQTEDLLLKADNNDPGDAMKEGLHLNGYATNGTLNSNLYNYESSIYNIQSRYGKPISSPSFVLASDDQMGKESMLNLSESENRQGLLSSSSFSSEDEEHPDSMIAHVSNSMVHPLKVDISSPVAGLRLREHFEHSPANQVIDKFGKGNSSKRSDQESVFPGKGTIRQNSVKDASVATEIDCSYNEYPNTGISQDSIEASKEEDRSKFRKGGESFLVGLIKKSFKDFSRSNQSLENDQPSVSINGQPIPGRIVRKAEKKAGQIHPGQYWYDYQAGFWGAMGYQCLGIIPPFIEEFNYPIPKNCSGGDTGVFVNGRELHQQDLDLLSDRGLPITRDKSYLVDISGRVFDEASGEELENLGKLAPTVEKMGHGFGMRFPGSMA